MTDRYDQDQLLEYLEGEGDAASRAAFERVMASDADLASLVKDLASDRALLRSLPEELPPHSLTQEVLQNIERRMLLDGPTELETSPIPIQRGRDIADPGSSIRWGRILGLSGMAAAVALAATIAVIYKDPLSNSAHNIAQDGPDPRNSEAFADAGNATPSTNEDLLGDRGLSGMDSSPTARGTGRSALTSPELVNEALAARNENRLDGNSDEENGANGTNGGVAAMPPEPAVGIAPLAVNALPNANTIGQVASGDANAFLFNEPVAFNQQLTIQSESPELSRQQIFDYCVRNGIPIIETQPTSIQAKSQNNFAVLVEDDQLAEIETMINAIAPEQEAPYIQRQQAAVMSNMRGGNFNAPPVDAQPHPRVRGAGHDEVANAAGRVETRNDATWELELVVPEKLGTEEQARQNRLNVTSYNNRVLLAQNLAPNLAPNLEPPAEESLAFGDGTDDAGHQPDTPHDADIANAEGESADEGDLAAPGVRGGNREAMTDEATPGNAVEDPQQLLADASQEDQAPPPAGNDDVLDLEEQTQEPNRRRRGNWLSPQIPLVPAQPLFADPPRAQLVELIIIPVTPEVDEASNEAQDDQADDKPAYKISMLVRFTDGGSIGVMARTTGENAESISLCFDHRTGSDTIGHFLIGTVRPTNPAARLATDDDVDLLRDLLAADTTELAPSQIEVWDDFVEAIQAELEQD